MKLGLVINRVNPEEKAIIKACRKHGVDVHQFNDQRIQLSLNAEKDIQPEVDMFLQRSLSFSRGLYTTAAIENKGYKIINSFDCLHKTGNKLLTTLLLTKNNLPTPETHIAFKAKTAIKLAKEKMDFPFITKPIIGSWGRLVSKINDEDAARAVFESKDVMGSVYQKIFYLQNYIEPPENEATDIRVFYLGGKCIAAMGRYNPKNDFRSNIAIGGKAQPYEITDEMEQMCQKIAEIFNGEILGIDLMKTDDGYVCIEVNGTPGFAGITRATNINIGEKIALYLKENYA